MRLLERMIWRRVNDMAQRSEIDIDKFLAELKGLMEGADFCLEAGLEYGTQQSCVFDTGIGTAIYDGSFLATISGQRTLRGY